jgi:regulatory protein
LADGASRAYLDGLTRLARRELSEAQARQRLARRGYNQDDIDAAIERLTLERALDDTRVAAAMAQDAVRLKQQGRRRILQRMAAAGIATSVAQSAVDDVFQAVEPDEVLAQALHRRLRGAPIGSDPKVRARLYRYLVGQGFEPGRVMAALGRPGSDHAGDTGDDD